MLERRTRMPHADRGHSTCLLPQFFHAHPLFTRRNDLRIAPSVYVLTLGPSCGSPNHHGRIVMTLYFVRHGESLANEQNYFAGTSNSPLTPLGRRQAQQAAIRIQRLGLVFDEVHISTLDRAQATARTILDGAPGTARRDHCRSRPLDAAYAALASTGRRAARRTHHAVRLR
ncbi:hypothetical protein BZY94_35890 [Burkholderia territorii]|nr:hypothetical protein BZY94_35890 [Burkholderia territorii]